MNKVQICNWLLTRRCNLKCSYCAIVKNYKGIPEEYPKMRYYHENEMSTEFIIEALGKFKLHNPDCFHIWYGGEPTLFVDLPEIINYCNDENIHYTVITNNTPAVQDRLEDLISKVSEVKGLTSSVDPLGIDSYSEKKSQFGLEKLIQYKGVIKDLVAEITVSKSNIHKLYDTVKLLTENGISSSITFIDISKSPYYDFSNVKDSSMMVENESFLRKEIDRIIKDKLDVHMASSLLPKMLDNLPSHYDCEIEKNIHNMTIDADGTVRLCLRIKGTKLPNTKIVDCFMPDGKLKLFLKDWYSIDKTNYCCLCNWTCVMMSNIISKKESDVDDLIHSDRR